MAGIKIPFLDTSTYARILLSEHTPVASIIRTLSMPIEELKNIDSDSNDSTNLPPLTAKQVSIATAGPFQPALSSTLNSIAHIGRMRLAIQLKDDDIFAEFKHEKNPLNIPESLLKKATTAECDGIMNKIDQQTQTCFDAYCTALTAFTNLLIDLINTDIIQLNETETNDLTLFESVEDLQKRYLDLNLTWPKLKYGSNINAANYIALKSHTVIYNALARQQKIHDDKTMQTYFKQLQKLITQTGLATKITELFESHKQALDELTQSFQYTTEKSA